MSQAAPLDREPREDSGKSLSDTAWDHRLQSTLDSVVAQRLLSEEAAERARDDYSRSGSALSFSRFLVERGLLNESQAAAIEAESSGTASGSGEVVAGAVFSGCRIVKKLGEGGMGSVYLSTREADGASVVVKFLAQAHVSNHAWRTRFAREATVARQIDHPHVVKVFGVDVEGQRPHIVMELVAGEDLEERLEEGPLPVADVIRIGRDVALGLAAAHAQGVVHRDVKPGNVRLTKEGQVKILDFGLAKGVETDDGVSLAGQVLGTPYYMAPEQWGDHMVDARTDVFALGATLYHLLTGRPPYPGRRPMSIYRKAMEGKCPLPSTLVDEVPPGLELAILRMLAVDRRARYATAEDCAKALTAVQEGSVVEVPSLTELGSGRVIPLVPASVHVLGRGEGADIALGDPAVSRSHARIGIIPTGYQLVDLESSYGTFVNDMAVKDVLLKSGDVIRCGQLLLRFADGGLEGSKAAARQRRVEQSGGQLQVQTLPEPFLDYLIQSKDKRVVIALLERLPLETIDARRGAIQVFLKRHFGGAFAEEASSALKTKLLTKRKRADKRLFEITFENLREDCEAWLTWWDEVYASYPPQLGPQRLRPRVRLRVVSGGPARSVELTERLRTTIGRGLDNDIQLADRSISRRHATVLRLHQRLMIRDEGSRFGTRLQDQPCASAFLSHGDEILLGQVGLVCELQDLAGNPPQTKAGLYLVDPVLFGVLCDLEHPSVATALVGFLHFTQDLDWVDRQAARLFSESADVQACARAVREAYTTNAKRAAALVPQLVPELAGLEPGPGGAAWREALEGVDLGAQLLPVGWFQASA
jgi:pSer/pThr/pTyr-binding forkhead associated (FHA) protein